VQVNVRSQARFTEEKGGKCANAVPGGSAQIWRIKKVEGLKAGQEEICRKGVEWVMKKRIVAMATYTGGKSGREKRR